MKIINLKELMLIEEPVLVSWVNMDEESVGEMMLCYIDRSQNRQWKLKATHFGVSAASEENDWLETLYKMIEAHDDGEAKDVPWEEFLSDVVPGTLMFTEDEEDVKFILYTKEDIKRMAAMFTGLVEKLS